MYNLIVKNSIINGLILKLEKECGEILGINTIEVPDTTVFELFIATEEQLRDVIYV